MAAADESFYKDVVRAGYRGPYLHALAADVAEGRLDLEALNDAGLPDEEVATIERRFRRYREYAGLAFWLYLTRDWVDERPI